MKKRLSFLAVFLMLSSFCVSFATEKPWLLVGTTGDYAPLTIKTESGYQGYSIDVIKAFARALNYQIKFVPTTWQTLSSDLQDGKFTIAVGGISENAQRSSRFLLTDALIKSGKVALIRCADRKTYASSSEALIRQINKPSVKVVENEGGTNAVFARSHFPDATIFYVKNNALPFVYLADKKADVMVTDLLEGMYKAKNGKYTEPLCVANPHDTFDHFNKVFMARKSSSALISQFDHWRKTPEAKTFIEEKKKQWLL